jgi:hypothetical protein
MNRFWWSGGLPIDCHTHGVNLERALVLTISVELPERARKRTTEQLNLSRN